jgi:hypothetical protein
MSSPVNQKSLNLAFGVHRAPTDAPRRLVLACLQYDDEAPAKALAVAMKMGGHKLASVAAAIGKSESYVCLLRKGKRAITSDLIAPLCAATGTNLLRQVCDAMDGLDADDARREIDRLAAMGVAA